MKRVLTAVVLIPMVLLLVFKAPIWLFALGVAGLIILTLREYLDIVEAAGIKPFRWLTYAVGILPIFLLLVSMWRANYPGPAGQYSNSGISVNWSILVILAPLIFGIPLVFRKDMKGGLASVAASIFGALYIGISLSLLIDFRGRALANTLIVFVLFSVWAGDIAAYYVGRSIGRHKLAPVVSPNKSWEGAIASVIASVAVTLLILHY